MAALVWQVPLAAAVTTCGGRVLPWCWGQLSQGCGWVMDRKNSCLCTKAAKALFMQPATVIAWHGPCSSWSGPLAQLQLGSATAGASSESKGLPAFARRRRAWLLVGNEMEELLLFWGHGDAAHPACICQGVADSSPSKRAAGCLGWLVLPCSASRETVSCL